MNFHQAELRMDRSLSKQSRQQRVQQVIKDVRGLHRVRPFQLGLGRCENTLIGIPNRLKGISCGESKRLAFACEILTDPQILFCDEPTSGLDSFMAAQVVSCLKDMSKQKKTIVVTIHQPSTQVFLMFDNLCLMAMGQVAYFGPVSKVCDFWKELALSMTIGLECPPTFSPADHIIRTLSMIHTKYEESEYGMKMYRKTHGKGSKQVMGNADLRRGKKYPAAFFTQIGVLLKRSFLTTIRDPLLLKVKLFQVVATSIIVGVVNFRTIITGPTVMNIEGVLYNTVRDMNFMFLFPSINMPQYTILPIIYSIIVYFMTALTYMPCFILPMLVFGGFYISFHSIPFYFNWISFLSWFRYGFETLQINQWMNIAIISGCENGTNTNSPDDYCPARDGIGVLYRRGMGTSSSAMFINGAILLTMFIVFRLIGLFALLIRCGSADLQKGVGVVRDRDRDKDRCQIDNDRI
uniref:ABC transporter domain-containing protein n=1 Tax=Parascaris equorum TaxID=6256 RepID=A0A914RHX3_PAREQ